MHNTNGITSFACTICTSEFKTKWNCSAHIRSNFLCVLYWFKELKRYNKDDIVHRLKIRFIRRTRYLTFCLWITSYVYSEDLKYCLTNVSWGLHIPLTNLVVFCLFEPKFHGGKYLVNSPCGGVTSRKNQSRSWVTSRTNQSRSWIWTFQRGFSYENFNNNTTWRVKPTSMYNLNPFCLWHTIIIEKF